MLLVLDVGNTNITGGVFDGEELVANFRLTSSTFRTSDEYGFILRSILRENGIDVESIKSTAIASVVPNVMYSLTSSIIKYFGFYPLIVSSEINTGISIDTYNPRQIGNDRIVDAYGAYKIYGGPVIVVDFGTATTYDYVTKEGIFKAGVTAPGIRISAKALSDFAANLPEIEIVRPDTILAKETISSMQAGIYFGQIGQTEYIISNMKREIPEKDVKVIATGGLGDMISKGTDCIDFYDANLTLQGIRLIYELNGEDK